MSIPKNITNILQSFSTIDLEGIKRAALLERTDTKFIFHLHVLSGLLEHISDQYEVLEINGTRTSPYKSLYFDTKENQFFIDHQRGKRNRVKVRMRKYLETDVCFLEIKKKDNKGNTVKERVLIDDFEEELSMSNKQFISERVLLEEELGPSLWNSFDRITLVHKLREERITIDLNLAFQEGKETIQYPALIVAELKQPSFDRSVDFVSYLKACRIHPFRISKYCLGASQLHEGLKANNYKSKILKVDKVSNSYGNI